MKTLQEMNAMQHKINELVKVSGRTHDQEFINVAQYIQAAIIFQRPVRSDENACDYDEAVMKRGKLIQDWLDAMYDVEADSFEVHADEVHGAYIQYLKYVEYLMLHSF